MHLKSPAIALACTLALGALAQAQRLEFEWAAEPAQNPGRWEPAFDHDLSGFATDPHHFNAIHMALIPRGPHQGKVLVWDDETEPIGTQWVQRYSILDPEDPQNPVFLNAELTMPDGEGDLFCSGHAWDSNGNLFIAGGTTDYSAGGGADDEPGSFINFLGGRLTYLWSPLGGATGSWHRQADLTEDRWYPTVVLTGDGTLLVLGGTADTNELPLNDYTAFQPTANPLALSLQGVFAGPPAPGSTFDFYPRVHHLSSGEQFHSGMGGYAAKLDHAAAPGVWTPTDLGNHFYRTYGTAVLLPNAPGGELDRVLIVGGEGLGVGGPQGAVEDVEIARGSETSAPAWDWQNADSLEVARLTLNATLLPDGSVLATGGKTNPFVEFPETWTTTPELYQNGVWRSLAPSGGSARTYHATAVLLPSGKVLLGGGDTRTDDYRVFVPPYLNTARPRPVVTRSPRFMEPYDQTATAYTIEFEPGVNVASVALMAPGSTTHHFDQSQRYVGLEIVARTKDSVTVLPPPTADHAPPTYYMLFLVSTAGVPSEAVWLRMR